MKGYVTSYRLTGLAVQAILNRVFDRATADGHRIFVAVVDHTGELAGLLAHEGTPPICREIAADKAFTSLATRGKTSAWKAFVFGSAVEERELMLARPRYIAAAGGCPIVINGEVVGGVGVSGASQEVDEALAEIGAAVPSQL